MKLPSFRRILKTDYAEEYRGLIETLSYSINGGIEVIYQAFNKAISLRENIACTVRDIDVIVDSTGAPKTRLTFSLDTSNRILGITVLNAFNTKTPTILPTSGVFISFTQENRNIIVNNIKGLPADQPFTLTVVAFDG
jgi:hypothetical protein